MRLLAFALLTTLTAAGLGQSFLVDVPPVEDKTVTYIEYRGVDMQRIEVHPLTCADKTRFLMTAEDGSKHCIALGNPNPAAFSVIRNDNPVSYYAAPQTKNAPKP